MGGTDQHENRPTGAIFTRPYISEIELNSEASVFTGDVERAKCKSALLHFQAEEPETGANTMRSLAQGAHSDPQGLTSCRVGMSRFTEKCQSARGSSCWCSKNWWWHFLSKPLRQGHPRRRRRLHRPKRRRCCCYLCPM